MKRFVLGLLLVLLPLAATAEIEIRILDVGQGSATLIQAPGCTALVDAGRHDRADLPEQLANAGVIALDLLVGTHPHADHIGQMAAVLARFEVAEVWMSGWIHTTRSFERALDAILASDARYDEPRAGDRLECGAALVTVLNPAGSPQDIHDNIALRVDYGSFSLLVTGDAEAEHERAMLEHGAELAATVLVLGHHGSATSSTPEFLDAVAPALAVYSASAGNPFGHPHAEVTRRLALTGIPVYGTDRHGTLRITSDGHGFTLVLEHGTDAPEPDPLAGKTMVQACVDLNRADAESLSRIRHIGPARAVEIIEIRTKREFDSVNQLVRVTGIGAGRVREIAEEGIACVE